MKTLKLMDREQYLVNRKQQLIERKAQYEVKVAEVRAEIQEKQGKVTSKELANLRYKEILFQDELNCICHKLGIEVEEPVKEEIETKVECEEVVGDEQEELAKFMESKTFNFVDYVEDSLDDYEFFIFNSSEYDLSVCIAHDKDFETYDIFEICSVCDTVLAPDYYNYNNFKLIPAYRAENTIPQFKRQFERWMNEYIDFKEMLNNFDDTDFQSYEAVDTIFYCVKADAFSSLNSDYETYMEGCTDMYIHLNNESKNPSTYTISCINSLKEFIKMITDKCTGGDDSYDMEYLREITPPCIIAINRMEMLLEIQEKLLVNVNNIA